jgi:8-amino-7-oxononanoate synthase
MAGGQASLEASFAGAVCLGASVPPRAVADGPREDETPPRANRLLESLARPLAERRANGLARQLAAKPPGLVDFCSNDYLGLARSAELEREVTVAYARATAQGEAPLVGSTGSRLLSGNNAMACAVEEQLCAFYGGESALLFNSGYDLNLGLFAALPQPGDVVVFDELCHNSIREGLRLMRGTSRPFQHNDCQDLERVLRDVARELALAGRGDDANVIVAVESVYSMDGHVAPLVQLCELCERFGASLVVDEAHGVGVLGAHGAGLVSELSLERRVLARVCTFGKAMGAHGAALVGPALLRDYMLNYCRPLIYSTALPAHSLAAVAAAHSFCQRVAPERQRQLRALVDRFRAALSQDAELGRLALLSPTAVQGVIVPGNEAVQRVALALRASGFDVMPIRAPTVPKGSERLRIILHVHNSSAEVDGLVAAIKSALRQERLLQGAL